MTCSSSFLPLDGVEFKLSDSLDVPKVDGLSSDFKMKDPTNLLLKSEYDFKKEKEVLIWIDAKRKSEKKMAEEEEKKRQLSIKRRNETKVQRMMEQQREVLQRKRELFLEQKRKQQQQQNNENENQTPDRTSPNQEPENSQNEEPSEEPPAIPPRNPFSQIGNAEILTPQPAARKSQDVTGSPSLSRTNQSQPVLTGQNQIWVDFEDKELDPFTNMELKTIDDMAELQSVLQNVKLEPSGGSSNHSPPNTEDPKPTTTVPNGTIEMSSSNPFRADLAGASSATNNIPKRSSQTSSSSDDIAQSFPENQPDENADSETMTNDISAQNVTNLYENIDIAEIKNIASKLERPPIRAPKPNSDTSIYSFAQEPAASDDVPTSPIREIFEQKLSEKVGENKEINPAAVYSKVVRPNTRALKSPDHLPVSTGIHQLNPIGSNSIAQHAETVPVLATAKQLKPVQSKTNPVSSSSNRPNLVSGTKVLPVSFGIVSNSTTRVVPPENPVGGAAEGNYVNITPGSISEPNLVTRPIPAERKPPVPPRDLGGIGLPVLPPIPPRGLVAITSSPVVAHRQSPHTITPANNNATNVPHPGHTHMYPPCALPQSNGPKVEITSSTTVGFVNTKPQMSPKRVRSEGSVSPSSTDASFLQKSQSERAKFEATMNKALSSLPQNPKPAVRKPKLTSPAANSSPPLPIKARSPSPKSILLAALTLEEREFVNNVTSMGFELETTIRAVQTYGTENDKVVDHLVNVQRIAEQGFPANTVQDAIELFKNDNKSVIKYLQQARQLTDMGFKENDVRNALKNHNNDQTLALDELMAQT